MILECPYYITNAELDILWFPAKKGVLGILIDLAFIIGFAMRFVGPVSLESHVWSFRIDIFLFYDARWKY